jgi:hypothetical protein
MPESITLPPFGTPSESVSQGSPVREYVDHTRHAEDAVEGLEKVANGFRLEALASLKPLPQALETFQTLSSKITLSSREVQEAASGMRAASTDPFLPPEGRLARQTELQQKAKAQLDSLDADGQALLQIAHAELRAGALPKITEGREAFARTEVQTILDATPASNQLQTMVEIARGADRDQAAIVTGPLGKALLRKVSQPGRELDQAVEVLTTAALAGSEKHGTPEQKAYVQAFRQALPAMQKYHATQFAYTRTKLQQAERGQ